MRLWGIKTVQDWGNMSEKISKMKFDDRESNKKNAWRTQFFDPVIKIFYN